MGNILVLCDCGSMNKELPILQRLRYDLSELKEHPVPMIWVIGPPGAGLSTQCSKIADAYNYEMIIIKDVLLEEALRETDRGRIIRENMHKDIPDFLVVDLLKEEVLRRAPYAFGFVINGFPRSHEQAEMYVQEVGTFDVILYLYADINVLQVRALEKNEGGKPLIIKQQISECMKNLQKVTKKLGTKLEKISTHLPKEDVFEQIQDAINIRLNLHDHALKHVNKINDDDCT